MQQASSGDRRREIDDISLARAKRGDADACRALVQRYQGPVFGLLSRMLAPSGRSDLIEDLAQECFLRVFRSLPGFEISGPARLSTWILTIASRLAIDELRRQRPERAPLLEAAELNAPGQGEQQLEQRLLLRRVGELMAELAPEQRAALVLRLFHELSYEEIAASLQVEVGTVKSRLSRARAALQRALTEVDHDAG